MKTNNKKETKSFSEFPREIEAIRNGNFFGFANKGVLPLQSFTQNMHSINPFFAGIQQPVTPWSFSAPQPANQFYGYQPFAPSFSPASQVNPFVSSFPQSQPSQNPAFFGAQETTTSVNISEDEESYIIELTVPGYKNEDCKVKVKDSVLYVYGRRELEKEAVFYSLKEYRSTYFERAFLLSNEVETEEIEASCIDGILSLVLPKKSSDSLVEKEIEITEEALA